MKNIKTFEAYNNDSILIIVDVQKAFKKFFNDVYSYKIRYVSFHKPEKFLLKKRRRKKIYLKNKK
jgi:hypothetical protein